MMLFLQDLFRLVVSLTLAGGFATLLVLLVKALTRDRLGPGWNYYIWTLPLALYLIPVALPRLNAALAEGTKEGAKAGAGLNAVIQSGQAAAAGHAPEVLSFWESAAAFWGQIRPVLAWIWLLGVFFTAALRLADGRRIAASLEKCCRAPEEQGRAAKVFERAVKERGIPEGRVALVICPGVESPLLIGLLRPRVVLPREDYPEAQLEMIFRHELGHFRSRDLWYKAAALGVACLHWFNPLVWMLARDLDRCGELWCDRRATGGMTEGQRRQYGRMLLDVAQGAGGVSLQNAAPLAMNKKELRRRLSLLRQGSKTTLLERAAAAAMALVVTAVGVSLASAVNPGPLFLRRDAASAASLSGAEDAPPPELWTEGASRPEAIPQPELTQPQPEPEPEPELRPDPIQMPVVLSDEARALPPEEDDTDDESESEEETEPEPRSPTREDFTYRLTDGELEELSWDGALIWPVDGGHIGVGFAGYYGHTGTDIRAASGTEIYAAADGIVSYAGDYSIWPYGKYVDIQHGDGAVTRYAHCSRVLVQPGERVERGQLIALVGRTGNASCNHCHFELRLNGVAVSAEGYIGTSYPQGDSEG